MHPLKKDDSVAQLVEHYTFNVGVLGSNPSGITKNPEIAMISGFLILIQVIWTIPRLKNPVPFKWFCPIEQETIGLENAVFLCPQVFSNGHHLGVEVTNPLHLVIFIKFS